MLFLVRHLVLVSPTLAGIALLSASLAQAAPHGGTADPTCESNPRAGNCYRPAPGCGCQEDSCQKPCPKPGPRPGPDESEDVAMRNVFAAPPRTGAVVSGTQTHGLRGPALTFPEITIRLPSLEFPCFTHTHRSPELHVDSTRAPLIGTQAVVAGRYGEAGERPGPGEEPDDRGGPDCNGRKPKPAPRPDCSAEMAELESREQLLIRQVEELQAAVRQLREQQDYFTPSRPLPSVHDPVRPVPPPDVRWSVPLPQPVASERQEAYPVKQSAHLSYLPPAEPRRLEPAHRYELERLPPVEEEWVRVVR